MPRRQAQLHCQVPCGIFDDKARIGELNEHCTTITKAMTQVPSFVGYDTSDASDLELTPGLQVNNLAGKTDAQSLNQSVRWITAKEDHANKILTLVGDYFLAQRVVDVSRLVCLAEVALITRFCCVTGCGRRFEAQAGGLSGFFGEAPSSDESRCVAALSLCSEPLDARLTALKIRPAMKTKQTTDPVQAESLRAKIHDLGHLY